MTILEVVRKVFRKMVGLTFGQRKEDNEKGQEIIEEKVGEKELG